MGVRLEASAVADAGSYSQQLVAPAAAAAAAGLVTNLLEADMHVFWPAAAAAAAAAAVFVRPAAAVAAAGLVSNPLEEEIGVSLGPAAAALLGLECSQDLGAIQAPAPWQAHAASPHGTVPGPPPLRTCRCASGVRAGLLGVRKEGGRVKASGVIQHMTEQGSQQSALGCAGVAENARMEGWHGAREGEQ
eukprot:1158063-Pelagomonas_calceolata.AAC.13